MEQWRKDGINQLEKVGYMSVLRGMVRGLTAPIWWHDPKAKPGEAVKHNGTICFVNTGAHLIGVTAGHVYDQYILDKSRDRTLECQIGQSTFDPERYLIANDSVLDLATFEIPEFLVTASGASIHYAPRWPPETLIKDEVVILGGFPGPLREEKDLKVEFPNVTFVSRVNQDSPDHISFYLNIPDSHWPAGEALPPQPDLGGMSGGPIFRIRDEQFETLELAGFIYESGQTFELVRGRHAHEILADGDIPS